MFRSSYVKKRFVQKVLCSNGLLFRSYVWKVLSSEGPVFRRSSLRFRRSYVGTHFYLSVSSIETFFISVHFTFLFYFLHNFIIHFFLRYMRMSSGDPTFVEVYHVPRAWKSERTRVPMFRSSVVMHICVLRCVFFVID